MPGRGWHTQLLLILLARAQAASSCVFRSIAGQRVKDPDWELGISAAAHKVHQGSLNKLRKLCCLS